MHTAYKSLLEHSRAINCDLPQSFKLMALFPAEHPRLKNLVKTILRYYIGTLKDTFCQEQKNPMVDYPKKIDRLKGV